MTGLCLKEKSLKYHQNNSWRKKFFGLFAALAFVSAPALTPAFAQVQTIDPNDAIDADLETPDVDGALEAATPDPVGRPEMAEEAPMDSSVDADITSSDQAVDAVDQAGGSTSGDTVANVDDATTYQDDDLIGAAEGVFGKGSKGLAGVIEDILKKQGRPNAYITGREASGAFIVGLRYGSGKLHHKIEGERTVYWTGPSIGFDFGGNASNSFVLVYNLYDTEELYRRFPAGEAAAYFVGGFHVSYLRSGDKVLIPVRLGAGLRLGANVGYMKFSKKQRWLPF